MSAGAARLEVSGLQKRFGGLTAVKAGKTAAGE